MHAGVFLGFLFCFVFFLIYGTQSSSSFLDVLLLLNNVYQSWMHISSFSLSFCQRFSEDECLQLNPTQASTR